MIVESNSIELGVSEFVALLNQTLEFAYPDVVIIGELANLRVSKNRWVYFDLKDENSSVKFFGTVYNLPGPLEDGMLLKVRGQPRLHNLYGFSVNVSSIQPAGEGSIRKAADLLKAKLLKEGIFDESRKRPIPYPPSRLGLITSKQSAAYADFVKILNARWTGLYIELIDVQVQGEIAPQQITNALAQFNSQANPPQAIILIRGGGSAEDLAAFSTEQVTRAVSASRVPTLVAIGHEIDLGLAELAADMRASTPSNAAELLVPDRKHVMIELKTLAEQLQHVGESQLHVARQNLGQSKEFLGSSVELIISQTMQNIKTSSQLLDALNPNAILQRGYSVVRHNGKNIRSIKAIKQSDIVDVLLSDGSFAASVESIKSK